MDLFEKILKSHPDFTRILNLIYNKEKSINVIGLLDIHKAHFLHLFSKSKKNDCASLFIAPNENCAQKICNDLNFMGTKAVFFPARDFSFHDIAGSSKEYEHTRLNALSRIISRDVDVVIACSDAALQRTIPSKKLISLTKNLSTGDTISQNNLISTLVSSGYERYDQVEGPGQFSVRGGIIDIFSPNEKFPHRIEFWGDDIDSIATFDVMSQRRLERVNKIKIIPANEVLYKDQPHFVSKLNDLIEKKQKKISPKALEVLNSEIEKIKNGTTIGSYDKFINLIYNPACTLLDYFNGDSVVFISDQANVLERLKIHETQFNEDICSYIEDGTLIPEFGKFFEDTNFLIDKITRHTIVCMDTFLQSESLAGSINVISINARQLPVWNGSFSLLCDDLKSMRENSKTVILAGTDRSAASLLNDLNKNGFNAKFLSQEESLNNGNIFISEGAISAGFEYPEIGISVLTYGHFNKKSSASRKIKKNKGLFSLSELTIGDYVVHSMHGIGVFKGIHKLNIDGIQKDYIKINYARDDTLYVPVMQLDLVDKYISSKDNTRVKLNRLGTDSWQKTKTKVRKVTKNIAKELIKLYSQRINAPGYAFLPDNEIQRDFESHFEYDETLDQLRCIDEIKSDMEKKSPMDRLLCGDVGVGKTEVALRAACKCVCNSKQCAILVPTTILAWQHYQTALKRFESLPVRIELLSRFRTSKQQSETLKRLRRGEIDIIVGTHRLVQKDVQFHDLGLVIIDEEQRFGVAQKERFKQISKNVDVLTLSATPIPRTLNMAMSGLRDMSSIEEAPQNRYPVQTYVLEHSQGIVNEAIRKELRRGGQVYYLHNNVETISEKAGSIQRQIPEARVAFAHGKMSEQELSDVWEKVINQEIDVLVCTTIIETGIDVSNVNTLIIENADHMGLSQLHQLRGRVGRSSRRAYAYFTYKKNKILTEISQKRLSAVREFTEFGSGFKIAMRDLEIRGAGNILGGEQHGHLADVGYDMYIKMLNNAVQEEKGEKPKTTMLDCLIDVHVSAHIPEDYISNLNNRIDIYRTISDIRTNEDALDVTDELIDRFGEPPETVQGLIDIALIRNTAASLGIYEIKQKKDNILLFKNEINKNMIANLIKNTNNQVLFCSGANPYLSVKISGKNDIIPVLKNILSILSSQKIHENKNK